MSRTLDEVDKEAVRHLRALSRSLVLDRLKRLAPACLTLDFDGSVIGTTRMAEGTAVGYNKNEDRPEELLPALLHRAQTGQVLDVWHCPGNVHDSNGARVFILACLNEIRQILPKVILKVRMDSAFFSDEIVSALDALGIHYTISFPFERLVQLTLFAPYEYGYQFKVILTNATLTARQLLALHNGYGAKEAIFAKLRSQTQMGHIRCRRRATNQTWLLSAIMAQTLNCEL